MNMIVVAPPAYPVSAKTGGSVEISLYQIASRVCKTHQVTILSRNKHNLPPLTTKGQLSIVRFPKTKSYIQQIISYIKKKQVDLIQVENRPAFVIPLRKNFPDKKIVLVLHSLTFMKKLKTEQQIEVIKKADAILCNSEFIRNEYRQLFPKDAGKFHAIYLGTDLSRFRPPTLEEKINIRKKYNVHDSFNVLNAGRIIPGKGIHLLVNAVGTLKNKYPYIKLILVGPCSNKKYRSLLIDEGKKAGIDICFTGPVKPSEMHRMYWLGDCFVLPTQFHEAFGLVNIEAMASGLPVIASNRGGVPEILNSSHGILVDDYQNARAFSQAIENMIRFPSQRKGLIKKGLVWVQQFSWEKAAERYCQFYEQLITST
jgi:spore coat protein SA